MLGKPHHPHGVMFWLQVFIAGFFLIFGLFIMVAGVGSSAFPILVLVALFFFALGGFVTLNLIGFRSQFITLRQHGISFRLAPLGNNVVFPWKLKSGELPWSEIRAVDVKLRNLGGPQRVYILRTSAGDVAYFHPQWPEADQITQEILQRSGAATSTEDMESEPRPGLPGSPPPRLSLQERTLRIFGTVMLVLFLLIGLLGIVAIAGSKSDQRWDIAKVFLFILIGAPIAYRLRRYRRIR
jgi:hypothetical protein